MYLQSYLIPLAIKKKSWKTIIFHNAHTRPRLCQKNTDDRTVKTMLLNYFKQSAPVFSSSQRQWLTLCIELVDFKRFQLGGREKKREKVETLAAFKAPRERFDLRVKRVSTAVNRQPVIRLCNFLSFHSLWNGIVLNMKKNLVAVRRKP